MEKVVCWVVFILVLCSFVFAGEWDSFEGENNLTVSDSVSNLSSGDSTFDKDSSGFIEDSIEGGSSTRYTSNFYIALGVGAIGLLIIILFLYFFVRGPRDKWKK